MRTVHGCRRGSLAVLSLALAALVGPLAGAESSGDDRPEDRKEIIHLLQKWEDAWNEHDMQAFGSLFHEDGVWVLWTGQVWTGRQTIEKGMVEVHKTVYRNSIQRERLEELRFVGADAAVLRFESILTGDVRYPDKVVHSRKIIVLTRREGAWRIGWGQNTRFADPPAK